MSGSKDAVLVRDARDLCRGLLRRQRPERWLHTQGVANRAAELAGAVRKKDRPVLIAAAWLHDIGYSPEIRQTGFHPLDGALYLRDHGWDERITALVAHHSGARFVPARRGFGLLIAEFDFEDSHVADALTYADRTVGPAGKPMTIHDRIAEAVTRHGPDSPNAQARIDREPYLLAAGVRVEKRLAKLKKHKS
jgi:putative nucleotidyltransferase with HDIG domain